MAKGSIVRYELADGSSRYMAVYRSSNGFQEKKKGFRGVREAERFLNKTMAEVDAGRVIASPDTFASYIDGWLAEHRPRIEEGTYRDYRVHVERRLKPFFGDLKLGDIAPAHVRRYVAELVEGAAGRSERLYRAVGRRWEGQAAGDPGRRIGAKTINNSLIPLRVALGHAVEEGLIARNPAASAPGARQRIKVAAEQPGIDFLRLSEIRRYLEACSADFRPLAEVLIACGLRIAEAFELSWTDVGFSRSALLVTGSRKPGRGAGEVSAASRGTASAVEFGPRIERALHDLRARQTEHGAADPTRTPVFGGSRRAAVRSARSLPWGAQGGTARRRAAESLRLHDLRHTAAASWLAAGLPLTSSAKLGHASIMTTERQYGHLEKSFLRGSCAGRRGGPRRPSGRGASRRPRSPRSANRGLAAPEGRSAQPGGHAGRTSTAAREVPRSTRRDLFVACSVAPRQLILGPRGCCARRKPSFAGCRSAPRETRTPTDQMVHKALNLARLPIPPQARSVAEYRAAARCSSFRPMVR